MMELILLAVCSFVSVYWNDTDNAFVPVVMVFATIVLSLPVCGLYTYQ